MQWQIWTAFGIMLGFVADLAFYNVPDLSNIQGLNWRLMMGSAMIPAVIVCCLAFTIPESPRWYLTKNRYGEAYASMCKLRFTKVHAARDLFYADALIQTERETLAGSGTGSRIKKFFTTRRTRNAMIASQTTMFLQVRPLCRLNLSYSLLTQAPAILWHQCTYPYFLLRLIANSC